LDSFNSRVANTNGWTRNTTVKDASGTTYNINWRNVAVANDCLTGTTCSLGQLFPSTDPASATALRSMALDSAQHALQVFNSVMTQNVIISTPRPGFCSSSTACVDANSTQNTLYFNADSVGSDGTTTLHEMGHLLQKQRFNQNFLIDNCTAGPDNSWSVLFSGAAEFDSCATTEGFATFVAAASWYDGTVANVTPLLWGANMESNSRPLPTCSDNRGIPLQSVKGFWDLHDATNEAGVDAFAPSDVTSFTPTTLVTAWDTFAAGTGNRQKAESDQDGVNVWDYHVNAQSVTFGGANTSVSLITHNCIQMQDTN
jgi:hypothetical protein